MLSEDEVLELTAGCHSELVSESHKMLNQVQHDFDILTLRLKQLENVTSSGVEMDVGVLNNFNKNK